MGSGKIIKYVSTESTSLSKGNTTCHTKPVIRLNYDIVGNKGSFGFMMNGTVNSYTEYLQIFMKYDTYFDVSVGGEVTLNNESLKSGDIVWLTNQGSGGTNGLYFVETNEWTYYRPVTIDLFIDLGARSTDSIDGDISRNIVTSHNIIFGTVGIYTITYYSLNSHGILSTISRKIKLTETSASLVSTDSYAISDYKITADIYPDLFITK